MEMMVIEEREDTYITRYIIIVNPRKNAKKTNFKH